MYGSIFIYFTISVIAIAITARKTISREARLEPLHFTYAVVFMIALAISAFSLLALNIEQDLTRISRFFLMVAPIISGLVIYEFVRSNRQQIVRFYGLKIRGNIFIGLITILIIGVYTLNIFNIYGSPRTATWNAQITRMGIGGSAWFIGHQNEAIQIVTDNVPVGRFNDFIFGTNGRPQDLRDWYPPNISSHFGNDTINSIMNTLDIYSPSTYLVTSEFGRIEILYHDPSVRHSHPQYTQTDYTKLQEDPAIAQIYSNNEFEVWHCVLESTDE